MEASPKCDRPGGEPRPTQRPTPGPTAPAQGRHPGPRCHLGQDRQAGMRVYKPPPTPRRAVSRARRPSSPKPCRTAATDTAGQAGSTMSPNPASRRLPESSGPDLRGARPQQTEHRVVVGTEDGGTSPSPAIRNPARHPAPVRQSPHSTKPQKPRKPPVVDLPGRPAMEPLRRGGCSPAAMLPNGDLNRPLTTHL